MIKNLVSIQEAYKNIVVESKKEVTTKFNVGDKVGIGQIGHGGLYFAMDSGSVHDIDKKGNHFIDHDNEKEFDKQGNRVPYRSMYDSRGHGLHNSPMFISSVEDHNNGVENTSKIRSRSSDMAKIVNHLMSNRNQHGNFSQLDKTQTDYIKSLLDKHVKE
jgi:hypothetical protein